MKEIYITDSEREKCRKVADAFAELYEIENILVVADMDKALKAATANEESPLGKKILNQLQENLKIAGEDTKYLQTEYSRIKREPVKDSL